MYSCNMGHIMWERKKKEGGKKEQETSLYTYCFILVVSCIFTLKK